MSARKPAFLDANAGAPLHPRVVEALRAALSSSEFPSNPSSLHSFGRRGRQLLSEARARVARSVAPGVSPDRVLFCSSGTEANQWVIGSFLPRAAQGCHWILSTVEHASVDAMVDPWIRAGGRVTRLAVDSRGLIRPEDLRAALDSPQTVLVTLNWVNNETGVILPIEEPGSICQAHGVPLHVDAAQAWGKIPLETAWKWAHFATLSSHKIGAPSGTGVVVRGPLADEALIPLIRGTQERGERGGTENVLGIWLTGVAAEAVDPAAFASATMPLQAFLESELGSNFSNLIFNGSGAPRVPNTVNFSVKGVGKMDLVTALDLEGFCVSAGSACSAGVLKPSRVLEAMGLSAELATAAVRVSWTGDASVETMTGFVSALKQVLERARRSEVRA